MPAGAGSSAGSRCLACQAFRHHSVVIGRGCPTPANNGAGMPGQSLPTKLSCLVDATAVCGLMLAGGKSKPQPLPSAASTTQCRDPQEHAQQQHIELPCSTRHRLGALTCTLLTFVPASRCGALQGPVQLHAPITGQKRHGARVQLPGPAEAAGAGAGQAAFLRLVPQGPQGTLSLCCCMLVLVVYCALLRALLLLLALVC